MTAQSKTNSHSFHWDLLGQLELPLSAGQNHAIHEWLGPLLEPLELHKDVVHKVQTSLQDAVLRAFRAQTNHKMEHVHLRIHVPFERTAKGQTWGFFRVDKIEEQKGDGTLPGHSVELYLYLEPH